MIFSNLKNSLTTLRVDELNIMLDFLACVRVFELDSEVVSNFLTL
jgi:hypothetical protein